MKILRPVSTDRTIEGPLFLMEIDLSTVAQGGDLIKDSDTANFTADVLDASMETPVIVDFWAPWCGPCKTLGPAIERVVNNAAGAVKLVKIDIDQNPEIAQQMRVQSIPAVFAFAGGRPVDGFVGALPESQIKSFVDRVVKAAGGVPGDNPIDAAFEQADAAAEAGDHQTAGGIYQQLLQHDPDNVKAAAGFLTALIKLDQVAAAEQFLAQMPAEQRDSAELASVRAALELAAQAGEARAELAGLQARVDADPADFQSRYDLSVAQAALGENEGAIDGLLTIMEKNRSWNEDAARLQLLKIFEALGPTDPVTLAGRRRLSSLLFS